MILEQNPNLVKVGGFENQNKSLYPNTSVGFQIPLVSGKLYHGLEKEEIEKVENYYGYSFNSKEGIEFYSNQNFILPEHTSSLNIEDNIQDLLTYRLGVYLGLICSSKEETKSPMSNALFYVYDSKIENKEKAQLNRMKTKAGAKLDNWFDEDPDYLVYVGKYLFDTYSVWTAEKALNDILQMMEENNSRNNNIKKVFDAVNLSEEEIKFVVDVKEAISKSIIRKNARGNYYNSASNTEYGKTLETVLDYLKQNEDEMGKGLKTDSHYSIRKQINA